MDPPLVSLHMGTLEAEHEDGRVAAGAEKESGIQGPDGGSDVGPLRTSTRGAGHLQSTAGPGQRGELFLRKRTRTLGRSRKVQSAGVRSTRSPTSSAATSAAVEPGTSRARRQWLQVTSMAVRMVSVVALRLVCPSSYWPAVKLVCLSGLPPVTGMLRASCSLLPAVPRLLRFGRVPLGLGLAAVDALHSLAVPMVCTKVLLEGASWRRKRWGPRRPAPGRGEHLSPTLQRSALTEDRLSLLTSQDSSAGPHNGPCLLFPQLMNTPPSEAGEAAATDPQVAAASPCLVQPLLPVAHQGPDPAHSSTGHHVCASSVKSVHILDGSESQVSPEGSREGERDGLGASPAVAGPLAPWPGCGCDAESAPALHRGLSALALDPSIGVSVLDVAGLSSGESSADERDPYIPQHRHSSSSSSFSRSSSASSLAFPDPDFSDAFASGASDMDAPAAESASRSSTPELLAPSLPSCHLSTGHGLGAPPEPRSEQDSGPHPLLGGWKGPGSRSCQLAGSLSEPRLHGSESGGSLPAVEDCPTEGTPLEDAPSPSPPAPPAPPSSEGSPAGRAEHVAYAPIILQRRMRRHLHGDQSYAPMEELQSAPWRELVFWHGRDVAGRPLLCVRLGLAVRLLRKEDLDRICDVIISHVEYAELNFVPPRAAASPSPSPSPEVSLLVDADGLGLMRRPPMDGMQRVGFILNRDYPGRGGCVYVVNPPVVLGFVISTLRRALVPRATREVADQDRGFLEGHEKVVVVGRRQRIMLQDQFEPEMLHSLFWGSCKCSLAEPSACPARADFGNPSIHPQPLVSLSSKPTAKAAAAAPDHDHDHDANANVGNDREVAENGGQAMGSSPASAAPVAEQ